MGIIDKTIHELYCESCDVREEARVLDKGSGWGGSHWGQVSGFSSFETKWDGGGPTEPSLVSANCKKCGGNPEHKSRFGGH